MCGSRSPWRWPSTTSPAGSPQLQSRVGRCVLCPGEAPSSCGCLCASCSGWRWACTAAGLSLPPRPWRICGPSSGSSSCTSGTWPSVAGTASCSSDHSWRAVSSPEPCWELGITGEALHLQDPEGGCTSAVWGHSTQSQPCLCLPPPWSPPRAPSSWSGLTLPGPSRPHTDTKRDRRGCCAHWAGGQLSAWDSLRCPSPTDTGEALSTRASVPPPGWDFRAMQQAAWLENPPWPEPLPGTRGYSLPASVPSASLQSILGPTEALGHILQTGTSAPHYALGHSHPPRPQEP